MVSCELDYYVTAPGRTYFADQYLAYSCLVGSSSRVKK